MILLPTLMTDRLLLRPVILADAKSIFSYSCNPNVARYVTWEPHSNIEETTDVITNFFFKQYEKGIPEPWCITYIDDTEWVIGLIGCRPFEEDLKSMEITYVLAEEHWGKGLVVEAARSILPYIFEQYRPEKLIGRYSEENPASGRVMEKLGMNSIAKRQCMRKGKLETTIYYSLELADLK